MSITVACLIVLSNIDVCANVYLLPVYALYACTRRWNWAPSVQVRGASGVQVRMRIRQKIRRIAFQPIRPVCMPLPDSAAAAAWRNSPASRRSASPRCRVRLKTTVLEVPQLPPANVVLSNDARRPGYSGLRVVQGATSEECAGLPIQGLTSNGCAR